MAKYIFRKKNYKYSCLFVLFSSIFLNIRSYKYFFWKQSSEEVKYTVKNYENKSLICRNKFILILNIE